MNNLPFAFDRFLSQEDRRGIAENLTEEELAIFDLLTHPNIELSEAEQAQVKMLADIGTM